MDSVSPVWSDYEVPMEKVIALDQAEYVPIVILPVLFSDGAKGMSVRFRLSEEERKAIAAGGDIVVTELTFGQSFTPISVCVCGLSEAPRL